MPGNQIKIKQNAQYYIVQLKTKSLSVEYNFFLPFVDFFFTLLFHTFKRCLKTTVVKIFFSSGICLSLVFLL